VLLSLLQSINLAIFEITFSGPWYYSMPHSIFQFHKRSGKAYERPVTWGSDRMTPGLAAAVVERGGAR
jgi:hypothetical protein